MILSTKGLYPIYALVGSRLKLHGSEAGNATLGATTSWPFKVFLLKPATKTKSLKTTFR
jgi:hypothetical protein